MARGNPNHSVQSARYDFGLWKTISKTIKTIQKDSYKEAYQALIRFVDQSLDSTRAELSQLLYPCFAHFYLKLMINGHEEMARKFYDEFSKGFEVGNSHFSNPLFVVKWDAPP